MTFTHEPSRERAVTQFDPPVPDAPDFDAHTSMSRSPEGRRTNDTAAGVPASSGQARRSFTSRFATDSIVVAGVGLVILTTGLIAITRGGFAGPMSEPVVEVLRFRHTTLLGLLEISIGTCVLLSAFTASRSIEVFFGTVLGVAGFVGAVQAKSFEHSLALESSMGTVAVAAGVIVVLAALLLPRLNTSSTKIVQL